MTLPKAWNYFDKPDDMIGPAWDDPFWTTEADRHLLIAGVLAGLALVGIVLGLRRLRA